MAFYLNTAERSFLASFFFQKSMSSVLMPPLPRRLSFAFVKTGCSHFKDRAKDQHTQILIPSNLS